MWLSIKEVAKLLGKTERTIQLRVHKGYYVYKYIISGNRKVLSVSLESLPLDAQVKYYTEFNAVDESSVVKVSKYLTLTENQRKEVSRKHYAVLQYLEFLQQHKSKSATTLFLNNYNSKEDKLLTKRQLLSWVKKYDKEGIDGLIDKRTLPRKNLIPDDVWQYFLSLWLVESEPSISQCYRLTKHHFKDIEFPHVSTFSRRVKTEVDEPTKIRLRQGKKAFEDKCLPYIDVDYSTLSSNQQWVADHHLFDVLVEDNGKIFRPWLTAWLDRRSRYILSYIVSKDIPNSNVILDSFAVACHSKGIPKEVLLDNGKDFKVYDLFNQSFPMSVANQMGIKVIYAKPYNAKAKPIERFFRTLEMKYCKFLPSYIGGSPSKRPTIMKQKNSKLKDIVIHFTDFVDIVDKMIIDYNNSPHTGKGMEGKTPDEVYTNSFIGPIKVVKDTDTLNLFLQRTTKPMRVGRNGINLPALKAYYDSEKLFKYQGKQVYARYNLKNPEIIYVYTINDEFICTATRQEKSSLLDKQVSDRVIDENNSLKQRKLQSLEIFKYLQNNKD